MIQINEIRLGNKVAGTGLHEGQVLTVSTIEHFEGEGFVLFFKEHDEGEYLRDCLPIPLTPEILGHAGFSKREFGSLQLFGKGYNAVTRSHLVMLEWDEKAGTFVFHNTGHPIRYVHQLQNFFLSLTGEDLEIGSLTHYKVSEGKCQAEMASIF